MIINVILIKTLSKLFKSNDLINLKMKKNAEDIVDKLTSSDKKFLHSQMSFWNINQKTYTKMSGDKRIIRNKLIARKSTPKTFFPGGNSNDDAKEWKVIN